MCSLKEHVTNPKYVYAAVVYLKSARFSQVVLTDIKMAGKIYSFQTDMDRQ